MWYGIVVFGLMLVCLIVYFVFEKKLKMSTIVTELLIKKYNKKLLKISKLTKKLKIEFNEEKFKSSVEANYLTEKNIRHNFESVEKIKNNFDVLNKIYNVENVEFIKDVLKKLKSDCKIFEFKDELKINDENNKYLEIFNIKKEKLNFEFQKYFGSQTGFLFNEKNIFLINSFAYVIDQKNIFNSYFSKYELKIKKNIEKNQKNSEIIKNNGVIYSLIIKTKNEEFEAKALVTQKNLAKLLDSKIKNSED